MAEFAQCLPRAIELLALENLTEHEGREVIAPHQFRNRRPGGRRQEFSGHACPTMRCPFAPQATASATGPTITNQARTAAIALRDRLDGIISPPSQRQSPADDRADG